MEGHPIHTITRIKLQALRAQRDDLRETYDRIEAEAEAATDNIARLRALYEGLETLRFAGRPLHPEVVNLTEVLELAATGLIDDAMIEGWTRHLAREIDRGRTRASHGHLLGLLLDEWLAPRDKQAIPEIPGREEAQVTFIEASSVEGDALDMAPLEALWSEHAKTLSFIRARVAAKACEESWLRTDAEEVRAHLRLIADSPYRPASLRSQAAQLANNPAYVSECAGALTIKLQSFDGWQWPDEGVPIETLWTRNRWRTFLGGELLDHLLLSLVGMRWAIFLKQLFLHQHPFSMAPETHIDYGSVLSYQNSALDELFMFNIPDSEYSLRELGQHKRDHYDESGVEGEPDKMQRLLVILGSTIDLWRARFPDNTIVVARTDVARFFPSYPHALALRLLEGLGFDARWMGLFERYLRVPIQTEDGIVEVRCGIPMDNPISYILAEVLLRHLEVHVKARSGVRCARFLDDIAFVAPEVQQATSAWEAVEGFLAGCGLSLNVGKSGATALGDTPKPSVLPETPLCWGFLQLERDGRWILEEGAMSRLQSRLRQKLSGESIPILSIVSIYNSYLQYLMRGVGFYAALGEGHSQTLKAAMSRLHGALFAPKSLPEHLVGLLRTRFGDAVGPWVEPGWLVWPSSAGGLGLLDPVAMWATTSSSRRAQQALGAPSTRPEEWLTMDDDWGAWFLRLLGGVQSQSPSSTMAAESLSDGLAQRVAQEGALSDYWAWVLAMHSDRILDRFGHGDTLVSELVPLELIDKGRATSVAVERGSTSGLRLTLASALRDDDDIPF